MEQTPPSMYVVLCETLLPVPRASCLFYSKEKEQSLEYAKEKAKMLRVSLDDWNCLATLEKKEDVWEVYAQYTGFFWNSSPEVHTRFSVQQVETGYYGNV